VRAESSVFTQFYSGKMQDKHSFQYSELSRHRRGSIHLKYIELMVFPDPIMASDHSFPLHESHIKFKYYIVLQEEPKFVIYVGCIKSIGPLVGKNTIIYFDV